MGALRGTPCTCPEDDPDDVRLCNKGTVERLLVPEGRRAYDRPEEGMG